MSGKEAPSPASTTTTTTRLHILTGNDKQVMGLAAALCGLKFIRQAIKERGEANVIVATGASQFEVLGALTKEQDVPWDKCHFFHLDEYIGITPDHGASFAKYLRERLVDKLPVVPASFEYVACCKDAQEGAAECKRLAQNILKHPIDVAFVGVGENGHLAFNDPPADFETEEPYLVVALDQDCRKQQLGEGWFPTLEDVPTHAISMSIQHIMKTKTIICTAPDTRKAKAIAAVVNGPVTNQVPASILQKHPNTFLFLDSNSAAQI